MMQYYLMSNMNQAIKHLDPTKATETKGAALHSQTAVESVTGSLGPACPVKISIVLNILF